MAIDILYLHRRNQTRHLMYTSAFLQRVFRCRFTISDLCPWLLLLYKCISPLRYPSFDCNHQRLLKGNLSSLIIRSKLELLICTFHLQSLHRIHFHPAQIESRHRWNHQLPPQTSSHHQPLRQLPPQTSSHHQLLHQLPPQTSSPHQLLHQLSPQIGSPHQLLSLYLPQVSFRH